MDTIIRPMERDDWGDIVEIYFQGVQSNMATFSNDCPTYDEWDKAHVSNCRLVIERDCDILGWAALSPVSSLDFYKGVAEVSIYIHSDHKKKGLGAELLAALVELSERSGFWTLESSILAENIAAIKLHEKCGFRTIGTHERLAKDRFGVWRSVVLMERRITSDLAGGCDCDMIKKMRAQPTEI
ncbi:MAG: N-acetyltransferase family protein [Oscillospiraceae bacterium]